METKQAPPHRPHGNGIIAPEIAIISPDTLSNIGLQNLLQEVIPQAVIRAFRSFADFADDTPDMYAHYFISAQVYFEHTGFFLPRRPKAIVLTSGEELQLPAGILTLNTHQNEKDLAKSCQVEPATMTSLLRRMEDQGLIRKEEARVSGGKRAFRVCLTDHGRDIAWKAMGIIDQFEKQCYDGFTEEEIDLLLSLLDRVAKNIGE